MATLSMPPPYTTAFPTDFPTSWASDWGEDRFGLWMSLTYRGVRQTFRWLPPGTFWMGSPAEEPGHKDDEILHQVTLSQGFWLADTTCTQALWQAVMGSNPSQFQGPERPVERVSWEEAQTFLQRLNAVEPTLALRLPTEAEWEYACRAGTTTPFAFGDQITPEQVNYDGNFPYARGRKGLYREETVPVQALPCNGWGLYQMHGNVWEWCQDWYGAYTAATAVTAADTAAAADTAVVDPRGPARGVDRVLRGGSWILFGRRARSARRIANPPALRARSVGFRCARGQVPG